MSMDDTERACSWGEIKGRLDPAWSYVVVETSATTGQAEVFKAVWALLGAHPDVIRAREICRETSSGNHLMLVQVDPVGADAVQHSLLGPRLPPSVTVFFYNHFPGSGT